MFSRKKDKKKKDSKRSSSSSSSSSSSGDEAAKKSIGAGSQDSKPRVRDVLEWKFFEILKLF